MSMSGALGAALEAACWAKFIMERIETVPAARCEFFDELHACFDERHGVMVKTTFLCWSDHLDSTGGSWAYAVLYNAG